MKQDRGQQYGNEITLMMIVFKNTETLTFKEILDHEETYNFDINKDGSVGDVVAEVIGYE